MSPTSHPMQVQWDLHTRLHWDKGLADVVKLLAGLRRTCIFHFLGASVLWVCYVGISMVLFLCCAASYFFFLCLLKRSMTNWHVPAPLAMDGNMWILVLPYEHKRGCVLKCRTGIEPSHLPPNWNVYNLAVTFSLLTHFFSLKFCFVSYWCNYSWIFFIF